MSETLMTTQVQAEQASFLSRMSENALVRAGAILAAGTVVLTGCSSNGSTPESGVSSASASAAAEACGVPLNLNENRANTVYGSPEALFPSLQTKDKKGNVVLLNKKDAITAVQTQLASDYRVLATWKAYVSDPRATLQIPDASSLARVKTYEDAYLANPELAAQDAATSCAEAEFMEEDDSFALTKNQGTKIIAERNAQGQMIAEATQTVAGATVFPAWKVKYNRDDSSLSADAKAQLDKITELTAINGAGVLFMNFWLGNNNIKVEANGQPVKPNTNGPTANVMPSPTPSNGNHNNGGGNNGGGSTSGNTPEQNPGPNTSGPSGPAPEASSSASETTPSGGNSGTPTPKPSTTPKPSPSETPTPTPTSTSTPTPSQSTTPPKGAEPSCTPVPGIITCP